METENYIKVLIGNKQYFIEEQIKNLMNFFSQVEALDKINEKQAIIIQNIDCSIFQSILQICKITNNKFPQIAKIKTDNPKQVIGQNLTMILQKKCFKQLNQIYQAVQYLNMNVLKKVIAAYLACRMYFGKNNYQKKKQQLHIQSELTSSISQDMRKRYGFLN